MINFNWRKPIIYFLLYLSGSKIPKYLNFIKNTEGYSKKELDDYQKNKLKKILLYSYNNVSYYKKIFDEINLFKKDGSLNFEKFTSIPFLTKEIIRREKEKLYSENYAKLKTYINKSGGSNGQPTNILQSKDYSDWNIANKIYYKTFVNQEIGDRELRLWGSERDILGEDESIFKQVKDFLYNRKDLNAFRMTKKSMKKYIDTINEFKPNWIEAYASAIYELAIFAKNNNLKIYSPKGIVACAGTLHPHMKKTIEDTFNSRAFNRYGSREVGDLACSCEHEDNLHISMWNNYIEVLPKKGNRLGKVYVTNLNNYAMPLIRYDISDLAELDKSKKTCECGRKNDLLKTVEGRETSVFKTKNGSLIPAEFFIHFVGVVFNKGEIEQFQIIQESFSKVLIRYVAQVDLKKDSLKKKVTRVIREVMGESCLVKWERVEEIETLPSGKFLYTMRKI